MAWVRRVLVSVCLCWPLVGCVTLSVTQYTRDFLQPVRFDRAVEGDGRLVVVYQVGVLHQGAEPEGATPAWGTLELGRVHWVAVDQLPDVPFPLIDSPLPGSYLSTEEGPAPELPASPTTLELPLVEIPPDEQEPPSRQRAYLQRVAAERPHSLLTVSRRGWPARLFLLMRRDDGQPMLARVQPPLRTTLRPSGLVKRVLLYPLAVVADLVMAPAQAVVFLVRSQLRDR